VVVLMFFTITVPAAVPSETHSSTPLMPSLAENSTLFPSGVK